MTQLKRSLQFLIILGVILLVLAYLVSINIETNLVKANSALISNNFLFACFSGALSSVVVLVITNAKQFFQTKKEVEQFMFDQLVLVYTQLLIIEASLNGQLSKKDNLPDDLLQKPSDNLHEIAASLGTLDYVLICKNKQSKAIKEIAEELLSEGVPQMDLFARNCIFLKIAIIKDQIGLSKFGCQENMVMLTSPNTGKTVKCLKEDAITLKEKIQRYLTDLDNACDNHFQWKTKEMLLSKVPIVETSLENFWAEYD